MKETMWGLQLTVPVRAPMTVFNKMSSEARAPLSLPLQIPVRKYVFLFQGKVKVRYSVCVSVMVLCLEPRGLCHWEQWCQLIKCL